MRVDLVHPPLHGAAALLAGEPAVLLLELAHWLALLLLGRPLQLDLQVKLTRRVQVDLRREI